MEKWYICINICVCVCVYIYIYQQDLILWDRHKNAKNIVSNKEESKEKLQNKEEDTKNGIKDR